jgi:prepilin-type processing-associated H-X9-DG protein
MHEEPTPQRPPRGLPKWAKALIALGIVAVLALLVTSGVVLPRLRAKQEEGQRQLCLSNLHVIGMALQSYRGDHGVFPPAYIADADGKPMHSWRVLILPYLQHQALYEQYDFDEPWNGPNNSKLASKLEFPIFACPSNGQDQQAHFLAVVGPDTDWPGDHALDIDQITDGLANTIAVVEIAAPGVPWADPRDLTFEEALRGINQIESPNGISSPHDGGVNVLFFDGHVEFLPNDTPRATLRALLTVNGGEKIDKGKQVP